MSLKEIAGICQKCRTSITFEDIENRAEVKMGGEVKRNGVLVWQEWTCPKKGCGEFIEVNY